MAAAGERDIQITEFALWSSILRKQRRFSRMRHPSIQPIVCLLSALLLGACAPLAPVVPAPPAETDAETLSEVYRALTSPGTVYQLQPALSQVRIYAFRGGRAARAGHNHVLDAPQFSGYVLVPDGAPTQARFDLQFRLDQLRIDDPAQRAETGGSFAGARSPSDIEGTRRNMLGPRGLDAERFPWVSVRSLAISGDWPMLVAEVDVTLHGVSRQQTTLLTVQHTPQRLTVGGSIVVKQSDFGVEPYSLLGGLLAVQDAVAIRFELVGEPARFD